MTSSVCATCHAREYAAWSNSHHDRAMQEASGETVLGRFDGTEISHFGTRTRFFRKGKSFFVSAEGPSGKQADFEIKYTFGVEPLQQYLVELPGGRLQALNVAWDARPKLQGGQRWFHLHPDEPVPVGDVLHWTGPASNWNSLCADCHSTNLRKNYSVALNEYDTRWSEIDVACEACHGPGSRHVEWASSHAQVSDPNKGLLVDLGSDGGNWTMDAATGIARRTKPRNSQTELNTCAPCHSRRAPISADREPGRPLLDSYVPALLEEGLYYADGQIQDEVYVYGSFLQSKMHRAGVTCSDCHDPHSLQVRDGPDAVCSHCHLSAKFAARSHHHHAPGSPGSRCVECHMPATTYMAIDDRRDHSFRVPRPDLSTELSTPNACTRCHQDRSPGWAAEAVEHWYAKPRRPHFGEILAKGRQRAPAAARALLDLVGDSSQPGIARATALHLLFGYPQKEVLEAVRVGTADADPLIRWAAAGTTDGLPVRSRLPLIEALLADPLRAVRVEAGRVLAPAYRAGIDEGQRKQLKRAIEEYRDAQLAEADQPTAHVNLALLYESQGELHKAEKEYRRALTIGPYFIPAYVNLADLYRLQNRDAEGEKTLRRALAVAPDNAAVRHALGLLLVRRGNLDSALDELEKAIGLEPDNARYVYVHGIALHSSGRSAIALQVLEEAHDRHPLNVDILTALAGINRDIGKLAQAREYSRRLAELSAPQD